MANSKQHIAALDGLRFLAAACVIVAHYAQWLWKNDAATALLAPMSGFGMALFFTLSGFVIHYNYRDSIAQKGGVRHFAVARISRLYPLFLLMFAADVAYTISYYNTACARNIDADAADWTGALVPYLLMIQSWFYATHCGSSLTYQFGQVSAVSWSVSVEMFLYLCYLFIARPARELPVRGHLAAAGLAYAATLGYFLYVNAHLPAIDAYARAHFGWAATLSAGYQDSLVRWLFYFSPFAQMGGFVAGMAASHLYMARGGAGGGNARVILAIVLALGAHVLCYHFIAPQNGFIGRTASSLYMPLIAVMIYALVRYPHAACARALGNRLLVKLGEASYSIYLLHAFLILFWDKLARTVGYGAPVFLTGIAATLAAARISYLCFEKPAMKYLRKKLSRP